MFNYLDLIVKVVKFNFVTAPKLDFGYKYSECILNLKREVAACPVRGLLFNTGEGFFPDMCRSRSKAEFSETIQRALRSQPEHLK